ncbi:hypothetical protein [Streptomyces longwoodensis]|uniref:hypothetical protein n=1 Tax=Streptomyces longwoodensis TaxID=68231 RepID=UPI0034079964
MSFSPKEDPIVRSMLVLLESMKRYEAVVTADSKAWEVAAGSSLATDDAKTHPYCLSHLAWQALGVGVDHLQCLRSTLVGDQHQAIDHRSVSVVLHTYAQATLLRAALENACRAVWLLASSNRLLRIQRRLSLQADSNLHSDRMHQLLGLTPPRTPEVRHREITDLAVAAGTPPSEVKKALKFVGFKNVVKEAGKSLGDGAEHVEAMWSTCSALAHGDVHNLSFLDRQIVATKGDVALTRLSGDAGVLWRATDLSVRMLHHGFELYAKRAAKA